MAVTAKATADALQVLHLTTREREFLIETARELGSATGVPTWEPLSGMLITVHHAGNERYEIQIH